MKGGVGPFGTLGGARPPGFTLAGSVQSLRWRRKPG
jgi:hypothetical protein